MIIKIIGSGIFGCTVARILAENRHYVQVIESHDKIGGNCSSHFDENGIEVHDYGCHIFHTDKQHVWDFVNRFTQFNQYHHSVIARHDGENYFLPFSLPLLEKFFKRQFTPTQARMFMYEELLKDKIDYPKNLEEQAVSLVGKRLYDAFIKNYTAKQWHTDPKDLDPSIIKRIPIRYTYDVNYFNNGRFQGIPLDGYQKMFENMLNHENIDVYLNTEYTINDAIKDLDFNNIIVYTGALDKFFEYKFGKLEWRSLRFENIATNVQDFQGTGTVNYVDPDVEYTRIHEYKHYHPENSDSLSCNRTTLQYEYPDDWTLGKECYYPIVNENTSDIYRKYFDEANIRKKFYVGGRLGLFKYIDMDMAVDIAMETAKRILADTYGC